MPVCDARDGSVREMSLSAAAIFTWRGIKTELSLCVPSVLDVKNNAEFLKLFWLLFIRT